MAFKNDFDRPQPRSSQEMENISAESMGQQPSGKMHAPRFHRMSISAAENGYSVDHTVEDEPSDNDRNRDSGDPMAGQGPHHTTKTHLVTAHHPAYHAIHAIHESLTSGTKDKGQGYQTGAQHPRGPQNR